MKLCKGVLFLTILLVAQTAWAETQYVSLSGPELQSLVGAVNYLGLMVGIGSSMIAAAMIYAAYTLAKYLRAAPGGDRKDQGS